MAKVKFNLEDVRARLAEERKKAESVLKKKEAQLKRAGGRRSAEGQAISKEVTKATQLVNSIKAAQASCDACCGCIPAQTCDFEI